MSGIHDRILAEYEAANLNRRLHMYLQLPELRQDFFLIEQQRGRTDDWAVATRRGKIRDGLRSLFGRRIFCFSRRMGPWPRPSKETR